MVNSKQKNVIDTCQSMLNLWLTSNDINSPSHYSLIDDAVFDLSEKIEDQANADLIGEALIDLLLIIRHVK